jgi:hypothetical protein
MIVLWKPEYWKDQGKFLLIAFPLMFLLAGVFQALMGRQMWGMLAIGALMSVPMAWVMGRMTLPRAIGFDGRRVTIDREHWNLDDVDSVSIGPELVRMNLYRPGRAGTEFTATAKEMDGVTWRQVRECCERIEAEVAQLCKL